MSENHDEPNHEAAGDVTPHGELKGSRKRFEDEKMTRREALRRIGMAGGMAIFAMLSANDLARIAAKKLQEHEASKAIGDTLAKEFHSAGVAFANPSGPLTPPPNPSGCSGCTGYCIPDEYHDCVDCPSSCATPMGGASKKKSKNCNAQKLWDGCVGGGGYGNQLACCQSKCEACWSKGSIIRPDASIALCQQHCAAIAGQPG